MTDRQPLDRAGASVRRATATDAPSAPGRRTKQPVTFDDQYLPLRDLARYSGLSIRTLRSCLVRQFKALPHYKIGNKILVKRSDFDGWAAQHRIESDDAGFLAMVDELANEIDRPSRHRSQRQDKRSREPGEKT